MSYLQIKRFIDDQIKVLNTPVKIDENVKQLIHEGELTASQAQSVLFKCNLLIKRHNRTRYNKQVVHQIVQQVAKAEHANLLRVNESLETIDRIIKPVLTDQFAGSGRLKDRIGMLNNLAEILPEGRYLFALHGENDKNNEEKHNGKESKENEQNMGIGVPLEATNEAEPGRDTLVRDNEEVVPSEMTETRNQYMEATERELEKSVGAHKEKRGELRLRYDDLRARLIRLNEDLVYKMQKLEYLKKLNTKLDFSSNFQTSAMDYDSDIDDIQEERKEENTVDALGPQMSRFNVLVGKLEFALTPG
ncbi:hypothetical protein OXX79_001841 [Metschnikowia pulcherrima]